MDAKRVKRERVNRAPRVQPAEELHQDLQRLKTLRKEDKPMKIQTAINALHLYVRMMLNMIEEDNTLDRSLCAKKAGDLLGYDPETIENLYDQYLRVKNNTKVGKYDPQSQTGGKLPRVPVSRRNLLLMRDFVACWPKSSSNQLKVKHIWRYFVEQGAIQITLNELGFEDEDDVATTIKSVRQFLSRLEYIHGDSRVIRPPKHVVYLRDYYLRALLLNRSAPPQNRLREVYVDESYIHVNYTLPLNSDVDPNDDQDYRVYTEDLRERWCFLFAIQASDESQQPFNETVQGRQMYSKLSHHDTKVRPRILADTVQTFLPTKTHSKRPHAGDYHKNFSHAMFLRWWNEKLLPSLEEKSLIILDTARYHLWQHRPDAIAASTSDYYHYFFFLLRL